MHIGTMTATLGVNSNLGTIRAEMLAFQREANTAFAQINAKLDQMNKGTAAATTGMNNMARTAKSSLEVVATGLDKAGRNIYYFGTAAGRFLTLPLTLAGAAAFKMAKDFEYSMQKIVGLVGINQSQVANWSQELLKMGPALGRGPKELAEALYFVTSSGFRSAQALDIVRQSAKASVAGLGEVKDIADLVTSAMNAYSQSNLNATRILDILVAGVREGKGEAADFAKQLGDVIPVAARMGVSLDQVVGAVSAVTLTGQRVSEVVTGLRQALFEIQKPAAGSETALKLLGVTFDQLQASLREKGLMATLAQLNDLTKQYGEGIMAKVFPNIRAYTHVLSLLGDRYQANLALQAEVTNSNGDAATAFAAVADTLEFRYNQAIATVQSSLIQVGLTLKESIIPLLNTFSGVINRLTEWFKGLSSSNQQFILKLGIFLALLGPITVGVGLLMRGFAGLATALRMVNTALIFFQTTVSAHPVGAFVVALGTLAAAMLTVSHFTNKARGEQAAYNDELERAKSLAQTQVSIQEQMAIVSNLTKNQLEELKERIKLQMKEAESYDAQVKAKRNSLTEIVQWEKNYSDSLEKIHEKASLMFFTHQDAQLKKSQQTNAQSLQDLQKYLQEVDNRLKNFKPAKKGTAPSFDFKSAKSIQDIMKDLAAGEAYISLATQILGDNFDATGEKLQLYKNLLKEALQIPGMTESDKNLKILSDRLKGVDIAAAFTSKTMKDMNEELNNVNNISKLTSSGMDKNKLAYDLAEQQLTVYSNTLRKFAREGIFTGEAVDEITNNITRLNKEMTMLNMEGLTTQLAEAGVQAALFNDISDTTGISMETNSQRINILTEIMRNLWEQGYRPGVELSDKQLQTNGDLYSSWLQQEYAIQRVKNSYKALADQITSSLVAGAKSWDEYGKNVLSTIRQIISAQAAVAISKAIVSALDAATAAGPIGLFLIPALVAIAIGAVNTALNQIPGFADGGTVPAGYPNDTYLARLSSGETIVPPGKSLPSDRMSDGPTEVIVRIDGYDLVGLVEKVNKRRSRI